MKKLLLLMGFILISIGFSAFARNGCGKDSSTEFHPELKIGMKVEFKNYKPCYFFVDPYLKVRIDGDCMRFTSTIPPEAGESSESGYENPLFMEYLLEEITKMSYTDYSFSAIQKVYNDFAIVELSGNILHVALTGTNKCQVFSSSGIKADDVTFHDVMTLDLSRYGKGIYIIKINGESPIKINVN